MKAVMRLVDADQPDGGLAYCQAAGRWMLLGWQHRVRGHTLWLRARKCRWWTAEADYAVRWAAGFHAEPHGEPGAQARWPAGHERAEADLVDWILSSLARTTINAREGEDALAGAAQWAEVTTTTAAEVSAWAPLTWVGDAVR